jgi:DNA modification methylase
MKFEDGQIMHGNCLDIMGSLEPKSIDLVITSPPYADQRKGQYQGISEKEYPKWTVEWMNEVRRLMTPTGSACIVIRSHIERGRISNYVLKTRIALHDDGWEEPEELIWVKPNSPPVGSVLRPRRSWEHILWFCPKGMGNRIYCDTKANGQPSDRIGMESKKMVGTVWSKHQNPAESGFSRSRDYVEIGVSEVDKSPFNTHPAQFPERVSEWIIRMLCPENGSILDPFVGSGSSCVSARKLGRRFIGIDISKEYCEISRMRLEQKAMTLVSREDHE